MNYFLVYFLASCYDVAAHIIAKRSLSGFHSIEVTESSGDEKTCLYVSTYKIWPYPGDTSEGISQPELVCQSVGLEVADISTSEQSLALQEMTS